MNTISISVFPNKVAQRCQVIQTGIPGDIVLAGCQRDFAGLSAQGIGVAVHGVVRALIKRAKCIARRWGELDIVIASIQVSEGIPAAGRRGCRGDNGGIAPAVQIDRYAIHTSLAGILKAIDIRIIPDKIADQSLRVQTGVPGHVIFTGCQRSREGPSIRGVGVAVHCIVSALVGLTEGVTRRQAELNIIVIRGQAGKAVQAAARSYCKALLTWQ